MRANPEKNRILNLEFHCKHDDETAGTQCKDAVCEIVSPKQETEKTDSYQENQNKKVGTGIFHG